MKLAIKSNQLLWDLAKRGRAFSASLDSPKSAYKLELAEILKFGTEAENSAKISSQVATRIQLFSTFKFELAPKVIVLLYDASVIGFCIESTVDTQKPCEVGPQKS